MVILSYLEVKILDIAKVPQSVPEWKNSVIQ